MARAVRFDLIADSSKFTRGMRDAQKSSQKFTEHTSRAGQALKAATAAFSVGVVVTQMRNWVAAARDSNKTAAQTATVLKSTHGAAGLTADQFSKLATQISKTAAIDDDLVQGGENIIATFTAIHGNVFRKTTQAAVDMTAAMNHGEVTQEGLQSSAIQLGKALNDPVKGLTALQRVGVTFSAQQKEQIANFVKHGQTAKAQGVILAEVNKEFGGSAAAAVTPAKQLAVTWGNMQEVLGNLLIPAIDRGAKILNGILGVVDRNRTAFGVLFGVLGTGAAVIGTLVVAEKIHAAVTDGVKAATAAWTAVQKGMNVVLGVTAVQAKAAAEAEGGLAAAGDAAAASTTRLAAGLKALQFASVLTAAAFVAWKDAQNAWNSIGDRTDSLLSKIRKGAESSIPPIGALSSMWEHHAKATKQSTTATQTQALETAYAAQQQEKLRGEMARSLPQFQTAADKAKINAEAIQDLSGKLDKAREEYAALKQPIQDAILGFDGLIAKSKVTAKEVIASLHDQVLNFRTYAHDTQRLLKAGVDQAAIQELSKKGPEYVHALATGSNAQLRLYKQYWHDRQAEIKTSFEKSMQKQYEGLVKKIASMNRQIQLLQGKTVQVQAELKLSPSQNTLYILGSLNLKKQYLGQHGMKVPGGYGGGDRVPIMAEPGEALVPKELANTVDFAAWAKAVGIPGFQAGGRVGIGTGLRRFSNVAVAWDRRAGQDVVNRLATIAGAALTKKVEESLFLGPNASVNAVAQRTAALLGRFGEWMAWARRILFESGGRWNAVNRTDSNWYAGHPSVGGAQVIRGTFARYADGFRGVGPFLYGVSINPLANSFAGGNYAVHRYGSLAAVDPRTRPYGYDHGGWLPPGLSLAWNGTGRAEMVGGGIDYDKLARAIVAALHQAPPVVRVDDVHTGLLGKRNRQRLGLGLG